MKRNIYLSNISVDEALEKYFNRFEDFDNAIKTEKIEVEVSIGRITAEPVFAATSSPNHNAAAMDGIAVVSKATFGANESEPVILEKGKDFEYINTGYVIHDPYDAVIMIEDVVELENYCIQIIKPAAPWQHIRPIGEDIVAGEMIIPANHKIRPLDLGALISGGMQKIDVYEKVKVGIIPTGTEIIEPNETLEKGMIYESNSRMFAGLVEEYDGVASRWPPIDDDYELLKNTILKAVSDHHMVIVNAGSSAGSKDYTKAIIEEIGEVVIHGIAIKPGKPTILGFVQGVPVIGIPGYPVSAYFAFETFAKTVIFKMQNMQSKQVQKIEATLSRRIVSSLKHMEYVRIKLGQVGEKLIATPLNRGAGVSMSLVRADGILKVPRNSEGLEAAEKVEVELLKDMNHIKNTVVSIGSHDIILDILGNLIQTKYPDTHLSSAHTGSMGGIMALKRQEAHIAPIHLLDEKSGEYNLAYIKKYFPREKIAIIKGVKREQGIMTAHKNPKNIKGLKDLSRDDIIFVNRQKGAGTRILTDYLLKRQSIDINEITGYQREMTTHTSAAAAVESFSADAAVGIYSAAKHFGLNFISIGYEEYDFAIPEKYIHMDMIKRFIDCLKSDEFKKELLRLGGYDASRIGSIIMLEE